MSARNNARKRAGEVHGIAAAFGGAKDIFNSALSKGSGDEMDAMFKKKAKDNQKEDSPSSNIRKGTSPQTSSSVVPFRPEQRPNDGSAGGVTTSVPTNKTETDPRKIVGSGFYKPGDIPTPANDNQQTGGNVKATAAPQKAQAPEVRDTRSISEREQVAKENPAAVGEGVFLPENIKDSLENLAVVKRPDENKGERGGQVLTADNDNENFGDSEIDQLNRQIQISEEADDQEDNINQRGEELVFTPPIIMIVVTTLEWLILMVIGLVGIILSFIIPPVGLMITIAIYIWKIGFGTVVFVWSYSYDSETGNKIKRGNELNEMRKKLGKAKKMQTILDGKRLGLLSKIAKKGTGKILFSIVGMIPFFDIFVPTNLGIVMLSSMGRKKKISEYNQDL